MQLISADYFTCNQSVLMKYIKSVITYKKNRKKLKISFTSFSWYFRAFFRLRVQRIVGKAVPSRPGALVTSPFLNVWKNGAHDRRRLDSWTSQAKTRPSRWVFSLIFLPLAQYIHWLGLGSERSSVGWVDRDQRWLFWSAFLWRRAFVAVTFAPCVIVKQP